MSPGHPSAASEEHHGPAGTLRVPAPVNAHSHAFHRILRGRTHEGDDGGAGTFWTWREHMYKYAHALTPAGYQQLATAVFAEMVTAGYSAVGEFHYLHHQNDGTPYGAKVRTRNPGHGTACHGTGPGPGGPGGRHSPGAP